MKDQYMKEKFGDGKYYIPGCFSPIKHPLDTGKLALLSEEETEELDKMIHECLNEKKATKAE